MRPGNGRRYCQLWELTQNGRRQLDLALANVQRQANPLQIADYLLAREADADPVGLDSLLARTNSAWQVGTRAGRRGLERRVALGVHKASDAVMTGSGQPGGRSAQAWEQLFGRSASASEAYRLAILSIEDAAIPVVSPANRSATLGTVIKQIEDQKD